ncbi:MAG: amylo-alpha-1,6-glucosidase [Candidatus Acidiferrales bacterium]
MTDQKNTTRKKWLSFASFLAAALLVFLGDMNALAREPEQAQRAASGHESAKVKESAEITKTTEGQELARAQEPARPLELTRAVRPWEFLAAVGMRAGLLGNESGRMEAWVYPLKILRDFHLNLHVDGRTLQAESLARTLITRPESSTIVYSGDTFSVRETFFVPVGEPGAVILLDVETESPLEIEAVFHRDFQLEWPAALGGTYESWDAKLHAFALGEEQKKFEAIVGSPSAEDAHEEFQTNYSESQESSFRLGVTAKGKETKLIVIAGAMTGLAEAEATYEHLSTDYNELLRESADYYRNYLNQTVSVELPDEQLQKAYDWARVSLVQGMVTNPFLGTGLVAGYRTSGESQRPGFAWYFGRDSFWSSLALNAEGDFANTKTALEFISKFQRDDGKIPHEISQGANFVNWFKDYPYPYASADATPLYIIATNDYVTNSGDVDFAKEKWASLWKAYQFLKSTYDTQGLPQNFGIGHGWVEGGPLLPVKTEFYQSGLGAEALHALSNLARLTGQTNSATELEQEFEKQKTLVDQSFWIADKKRYAFALDKNDKQVDELNVLATAPMWFGSTVGMTAARRVDHLHQLADPAIQTDWGMRIISDRSPVYSGGGYHYGSVWPLFTGWASVAEYRYHQESSAYENLRANALLALDGSLGHVTEVLSGDYYQPLSTSSPHQIWSAAMVVSPLLKGMFGLEKDATRKTLTFVPHVPASWTEFQIKNVRVGASIVGLSYHKTLGEITLEATRTGGDCRLDYELPLPNTAWDVRVDVNGRVQSFDNEISSEDHHVKISIALKQGKNTIRIRAPGDFGVSYESQLPELGSKSEDLRILSKTIPDAHSPMELDLEGRAGTTYEMEVWNPGLIESVQGAELVKDAGGSAELRVQFAARTGEEYSRQRVVIYFRLPKIKTQRKSLKK